jgi:hypothetical protein
MSEASARRKPNDQPALLDTELEHLPAELRQVYGQIQGDDALTDPAAAPSDRDDVPDPDRRRGSL